MGRMHETRTQRLPLPLGDGVSPAVVGKGSVVGGITRRAAVDPSQGFFYAPAHATEEGCGKGRARCPQRAVRGCLDARRRGEDTAPYHQAETLHSPRHARHLLRRQSGATAQAARCQTMSTSKRITLTKAQLASDFGQRLVAELTRISEDGCFTLEEIRNLHDLLAEGSPELPSVPFLRGLTTTVLLDGQLDDYEAYELRLAIERVLPKTLREQIGGKLKGIQRPIEDEIEVTEEPATERQLEYIRILGGTVPPGLGKWEASDLINELKQRAPVSPRQMMVLRFWNRLGLASQGRQAVSEWMDRHYTENSDRLEAWELFKAEHGDDGTQRDPSWVPIGVGERYLLQVKRGGTQAASSKKGCLVMVLLILSIAVASAIWKGLSP
jgi:hypothetical protein